MTAETWYVLEDGTAADPRYVAPDAAGWLRHRDGRAVAYAPHGPRSRSVDPEDERSRTDTTAFGGIGVYDPPPESVGIKSDAVREMRPQRRGRRYRTRAV